jgi:type IV pilus assembly protein PilB
MAPRLGEILVGRGCISEEQLKKALHIQQQEGGKLGSVLVRMGLISEQQIVEALSTQFDIPIIDLKKAQVGSIFMGLVPRSLARRLMVLPLWERDGVLTVALADPTRLQDLEEIRRITGCEVEPRLTTPSAVNEAIDKPFNSLRTPELQRIVQELETSSVEK